LPANGGAQNGSEKRERWMRLCVEAADEQDSNRLLDIFSEVNRLLHEKSCGSEMCDEKQASTLSKLLRKRHPSNPDRFWAGRQSLKQA